MALALEDIGGESCEPVGGLAATAYIALHSDFETINDPADICGDNLGADLDAVGSIAADHVFKADKGFVKLKCIPETGNIQSTLIGERRRRLFQNQLVIEIEGSEANMLGFLRNIKNADLVILVEEYGSGRIRQFGSDRLGAWLDGIDSLIEAVIEGKNSATVTMIDKQKWVAPVYKGTITEKPVV